MTTANRGTVPLLSRAELFWAALQYIIFRYGAVVSETLQRQTKLVAKVPP